jgi:hypothetical protein
MPAKNRFNPIDAIAAALPDEEYFPILARDPAMPALIGIWASLRVGNVAAAAENFTLLMSDDLVAHYMRHPDHAKSAEAIQVAQRAAEWRAANVGGPNGVPTWKSSLVRPKMMELSVVDDSTGRPAGDHGTANQAIEYALNVAEDHEAPDFLRAWQQGDLGEWPEFYDWLKTQEISEDAFSGIGETQQ